MYKEFFIKYGQRDQRMNGLFNGDGLGQVARKVHVNTGQAGKVVREQLQGNDG